ncbi:MAG: ABC transporter ATP-binding protein [Prolixibacteraceae bacterium]
MSERLFMIRSFGLFFRYRPVRISLLFLITLLLGFGQGVTIVLLIPLLGLLVPHESPEKGEWTSVLDSLVQQLGFSLSLELVLLIFAVCLLSVAALSWLQSVWQSGYQQGFSHAIRGRLFKKVITSDWLFLSGKSRHNHTQLLTAEVPKMTTYYYFYLNLAGHLIFIFAHVVLAFLLSPVFTLVVAAGGILILILLRKYLTRAERLGAANIQAYRLLLKRVDEFWSVVKPAKVHHTEAFYLSKFDETNRRVLHYQDQQIRNRALPQFLFTLAGILSLVAVVYGAYRFIQLPLASLFVLILLFARIFPRFTAINNDLNMMVSNAASVRMILQADREMEEHDLSAANGREPVSLSRELEIRNLTFGYEKKHPLFDGFSESIPAGRITGIVGASGSGKTTLIDLLAGLLRPETGAIVADGVPLTERNTPSWKSRLGYLPQDAFFIDGTLRENLVWDSAYNPGDGQIMEALRQVNAEHLVSRQKEGLDTSLVNYPYHFSGGERQRLALARVLLRRPQLLLLDEATSSLDPENEARIMECLVNLKGQVTIIFVTHRESLHPWFDKIIRLTPPRSSHLRHS